MSLNALRSGLMNVEPGMAERAFHIAQGRNVGLLGQGRAAMGADVARGSGTRRRRGTGNRVCDRQGRAGAHPTGDGGEKHRSAKRHKSQGDEASEDSEEKRRRIPAGRPPEEPENGQANASEYKAENATDKSGGSGTRNIWRLNRHGVISYHVAG